MRIARGLTPTRRPRQDPDGGAREREGQRPPPGLLVLGMHRSGTSAVAGLLHALGLDPGPVTTLIAADEFNQDGYWEQRPVVQLNDDLLRARRGFASAPPRRERSPVPASASERISALVSRFERPWFVKDPRICLLMDAWQHAVGTGGFPVVVTRDPRQVAASLGHRNGYGPEMSVALWERYTHDLLAALSGRSCLFIRYDHLVAEPDVVIEQLATVAAAHLGDPAVLREHRLARAVALVRPRAQPVDHERSGVALTSAQHELCTLVTSLEGRCEAFTAPRLPSPSRRSQQILERRRRMLLVIDRSLPSNAGMRALGDRRALSH